MDLHEDAVRSAVEELVAASHKAIAVRCNVADEAEVKAMVAQTVSTFGRLDAAFNNAGVQSPAVETADVRVEEFDRVNAINLRGVFNCMKYELQQMREQESGAIVNCSSPLDAGLSFSMTIRRSVSARSRERIFARARWP